MELEKGHKIGQYEVVQRIGRGSMGTVYLCDYPRIGAQVAIKVLHPRHFHSDWVVDRFLAEAKIVNQVGHPGIVRIYDCKVDPDLGPYLVMEYMKGETLKERYLENLPLKPEVVSRILLQVASALSATHRAGIIHRDLKPANLYICEDPDMPTGERVRLLDFGIAKLMNPDLGSHIKTMAGMLPGSPHFMAPEQMVDANLADARSDIYSLGVIAYQLLTGRYPHQADSIGRLIIMRQEEEPISPRTLNPEISPDLERVIMKALEKEPDCRYQTMDRFRTALCDAVLEEESDTLVHRLMVTRAPRRVEEPIQLMPVDVRGLMPVDTGAAPTLVDPSPPKMTARHALELPPDLLEIALEAASRPPRTTRGGYSPLGRPVIPAQPGRRRQPDSTVAIIGAAATLLLAAMLIGSYSLF